MPQGNSSVANSSTWSSPAADSTVPGACSCCCCARVAGAATSASAIHPAELLIIHLLCVFGASPCYLRGCARGGLRAQTTCLPDRDGLAAAALLAGLHGG